MQGARKRTPQGAERLYPLLYKHRQKDHVQPVHIIEMLNRNVPGRVDVGRIDLMQSFSFFECPSEFAEEIVTGMNGINYKGRQIHVEIAEQRDENPDAGVTMRDARAMTASVKVPAEKPYAESGEPTNRAY